MSKIDPRLVEFRRLPQAIEVRLTIVFAALTAARYLHSITGIGSGRLSRNYVRSSRCACGSPARKATPTPPSFRQRETSSRLSSSLLKNRPGWHGPDPTTHYPKLPHQTTSKNPTTLVLTGMTTAPARRLQNSRDGVRG